MIVSAPRPGARLLPALAALFALTASSPAPAAAQRETWEPPIELAMRPWPAADGARPYRYVLSLRASSEVEVIADARLLRLEIRVPGRRRPHRCEMPGRPRRADESRAVTLAAGERWAEWIDLRELCWGRSLEALATPGATITATYELARGRHAWVARAGADGPSARALAEAAVWAPAVPDAAEPAGADARVTLSSTDARSHDPTLRVAVYGSDTTRRAWVRPDRFRFRVLDPSGGLWECTLGRTGGTAIPDLFSRISSRRAVRFSLEGGAYCPAEVFERAGVYEVTPIVELDEDGSAWELDAVVGTFVGAPAAVRIRGDRGDRSVPAEVLREVFR